MRQDLWQYLREVWVNWLAVLIGVVSGLLGLVLLAFPNVRLPSGALLVIALAALFYAQFLAYRRLQLELTKQNRMLAPKQLAALDITRGEVYVSLDTDPELLFCAVWAGLNVNVDGGVAGFAAKGSYATVATGRTTLLTFDTLGFQGLTGSRLEYQTGLLSIGGLGALTVHQTMKIPKRQFNANLVELTVFLKGVPPTRVSSQHISLRKVPAQPGHTHWIFPLR